jgi:hypothetical protein
MILFNKTPTSDQARRKLKTKPLHNHAQGLTQARILSKHEK